MIESERLGELEIDAIEKQRGASVVGKYARKQRSRRAFPVFFNE
jgi:hypothetical protein